MYKNLIDYLPEFTKALVRQFVEDERSWGNTWQQRPKAGLELRVKVRFDDYFAQFQNVGTPVPWLRIAGEALIAWVREQNL